ELVLRNQKLITFVVLDRSAGMPIELYGLGIASKPNLGFHGGVDFLEIPLRDYPHGESTTRADPARHVVRVQSPGYAPVELDIAPDDASGPRQTIRLEKGAVLAGRISSAGRPIARAEVIVMRGPLATVPRGRDPVAPDSWFMYDFEDYKRDL